MMEFDFDKIARDTQWLIEHPQFAEKPATILEFIGPGYLDCYNAIRPGVREALVGIFGEEVSGDRIADVSKAVITGAIGIGKTTIASIALPYMVHWILCLRDPQGYFELLPGSRIAFMMMSTSETQARDVIFSDIFARIRHSKWFSENYPYDPLYKKQIKFAKDINILPGDSKETTFEGYNIMGGVLDEMDSHTVTKDKDYADIGWETIENRMVSRFGHRGLVIAIGQMKKSTGFAARKYAECLVDPDAYAVRMTIWESRGWDWKGDPTTRLYPFLKEDGTRDSFYYDFKRKQFIPKAAGDLLPESNTLLEIPEYYRKDFENKPEKSLKDLAGIPPKVTDVFISRMDKIEACRDRWIERSFADEPEVELAKDLSIFSPVSSSCSYPEFQDWFTNVGIGDGRKRAVHIDIAYSANGDCLGMAMGHVAGLKDDGDEEDKPIFRFDFLMRIKAPEGQEVILGDVRKILYFLRDERKFRIGKVTYDGFESTDSVQILRKKRFTVDKVSIDKSKLPYEDVRDAIYEERLEFPPYITEWNRGGELVEIAVKELSELQDVGKKIDHPPNGSKDVADTIAGVVHELIGDRRYKRGVTSLSEARQRHATKTGTDDVINSLIDSRVNRQLWDNRGTQPPNISQHIDGGIIVPLHLRPRR